MKKTTLLTLLFAAGSAILVAASAAQAAAVTGAVSPTDDGFTFDVLGFNTDTTTNVPSGGFYVVSPEAGSFGTVPALGKTTLYSGADVTYDNNGQVISVNAIESIGANTTTDTFTVSTSATSFLNETMVNGLSINSLQLDIGDSNAGTTAEPGGEPVSVLLPITSYSAVRSTLYGMSSTPFSLNANTVLGSGNTSYTAFEGPQTGTTAVSSIGFHKFHVQHHLQHLGARAVDLGDAGAWLRCGYGSATSPACGLLRSDAKGGRRRQLVGGLGAGVEEGFGSLSCVVRWLAPTE
jgi:hypothetical protein